MKTEAVGSQNTRSKEPGSLSKSVKEKEYFSRLRLPASRLSDKRETACLFYYHFIVC